MNQSEIQSRAKFDQVRYANVWEDADTLVQALRPASKSCLSIGSAGDNAFALLAAGASSVTAVEMNPAQVACIELRKAAYEHLDYPAFLTLHGELEGDRLPLYRQCAESLTNASRAYWEKNSDAIALGYGLCGKFENYFQLFRRKVIPLIHSRRKIEELLTPKSVEERRLFYANRWDSWRWRGLFKIFFSRKLMGLLGRDPAFFDYVVGSVGERILERTKYALTELDPHTNPYLRWILNGRYGSHLPYALREEHFAAIKSRISDFSIECRPLETVLARGQARYDAFNLSDIFEYMSEENYHKLLLDICTASHPGARLAYWNMLVPRQRPESMSGRLRRLEQEAESLHAADKAFFYSRFVLEEVK